MEFNFTSYNSTAMLDALWNKSVLKQSSGITVLQCYYTGRLNTAQRTQKIINEITHSRINTRRKRNNQS
jgi:hypothetical protein